MEKIKKISFGNSGSATFLAAAAIGILVTSLLGVLYMAEAAHQKALMDRASTLESFYTNELAQWNGYERTRQGADLGITPGAKGYVCTLSNGYSTFLPQVNLSFPSEAYAPSAPETTAYSLKTTSLYDLIGSLNRRLVPGNLHYQVLDK